MWQTILGASLVLIGVAAYIWHRLQQGTKAETDAALKDAQIARDAETKKALEAQLAAKAKLEMKELKDETNEILALPPSDERLRRALELLARTRGAD